MALQHLRSSTANKRPTPAGMSDGQLALNTNNTSPGLFFKDSNGALVKVGPVHVGTTAPNATPGAGGSSGNSVGEQWLDTTGGSYVFKVWDGSAWRSESGTFVDVNGDVMTGALGIIAGSASAPGLYISGDANTGLYSPGADQVSVATGGTERLRIDSTGQIEAVSLGTAAAPVFSFTGDPNTGIYSPGADQVAISTNGTGRLFVDPSGRVAIGTTSASQQLTVVPSGSGGILVSAPSGQSGFTEVAGGADTVRTRIQSNTDVGFVGTLTNHPLFFQTNNTERLRITSAGLVGIGTSSPSRNLEVVGTADTVVRVTAANSFTAVLDLGTVAAPTAGRIAYDNGNNLGLYSNSVERVRIDSSGRVGIGTTSPGATLDVAGNQRFSAANPVLEFNNGGPQIFVPGANTLAFATGGGIGSPTERARIDISGRLLVGTSSASATVSFNPFVQLNNTNGIGQYEWTNDAGAPKLWFAKARSGTVGSQGIVQSGDQIMRIAACASDGTAFVLGAEIRAEVDGTPGANDMPGRLVFSTCSDNSASPTERLRITSTGQVRLAGAGITFNGDTATANELDDYEEGTFTPSIVGTSTAGTATYGANGQVGRYTKIGNRVFFDLYLAWSAHTGTGNLEINGLPFTVQNTTNLNRTYSAVFSNVSLTAANIGAAFSAPNTTTIALRQMPTGGGAVATIPMDTSAQISISGSFDV